MQQGQSFTVNVTLSGLGGVGEPTSLTALAVQVGYDLGLAGTPVISAGPIVPDPTPPAFIGTAPVAGTQQRADASYETLATFPSAPNITANGIFYSFTATAGPSSGSGSISFAGTLAFDQDDQEVTVSTGAPLVFNVEAEPEPVPLPAAGAGAAVLCGMTLFRRVRRSTASNDAVEGDEADVEDTAGASVATA